MSFVLLRAAAPFSYAEKLIKPGHFNVTASEILIRLKKENTLTLLPSFPDDEQAWENIYMYFFFWQAHENPHQ